MAGPPAALRHVLLVISLSPLVPLVFVVCSDLPSDGMSLVLVALAAVGVLLLWEIDHPGGGENRAGNQISMQCQNNHR